MSDPTLDPDCEKPICRHCGKGDIERTEKSPRRVVLIMDEGNFHSSCYPVWRREKGIRS